MTNSEVPTEVYDTAIRLSAIDSSLITPEFMAEVVRAARAGQLRREVQGHIESLKAALAGAASLGSYLVVPHLSRRLEEEEWSLTHSTLSEIDAGIGDVALELAAGRIAEAMELVATPPVLGFSLEREAWEGLPEEVFPMVSPVVTRPEDVALEAKLGHREAIREAIGSAVAQWQEVRLGGGGDALNLLASASAVIAMLRDLTDETDPLRDEIEASNRRRQELGFGWTAPPDTDTAALRVLAEFRARAGAATPAYQETR